MVIIPKPNKPLYDSPKSFCPIVLLNTIGKLIEKVIGERLQFLVVRNDFIVMECFGPNILFFFYFSFDTSSFSFFLSFRTMKKSHDKEVT